MVIKLFMQASPRVCKLPHISTEPKINPIEEGNKGVYEKKFKNFFRLQISPIKKNKKLSSGKNSSRFRTQHRLSIDDQHITTQQKAISEILKLKKISDIGSVSNLKGSICEPRDEKQIVNDINHSLKIINTLQKERRKTTQFFSGNQSSHRYKSLAEQIIGIETKDIEQQIQEENSSVEKQQKIIRTEKKMGLYSYFQRNFIERNRDLTKERILTYARHPNDKKYEGTILGKSREFIKETVSHDYTKIEGINELLQKQSKKFIESEVKVKKDIYSRDYKNRKNSPYFGFLTLNRRQKSSIISRILRKKSLS